VGCERFAAVGPERCFTCMGRVAETAAALMQERVERNEERVEAWRGASEGVRCASGFV